MWPVSMDVTLFTGDLNKKFDTESSNSGYTSVHLELVRSFLSF